MLSPAAIPEIDPKQIVNQYEVSEKDLSEWFGVSYQLVRMWFSGHKEPQRYHRKTAGLILHNLENGILEGKKRQLFTR